MLRHARIWCNQTLISFTASSGTTAAFSSNISCSMFELCSSYVVWLYICCKLVPELNQTTPVLSCGHLLPLRYLHRHRYDPSPQANLSLPYLHSFSASLAHMSGDKQAIKFKFQCSTIVGCVLPWAALVVWKVPHGLQKGHLIPLRSSTHPYRGSPCQTVGSQSTVSSFHNAFAFFPGL